MAGHGHHHGHCCHEHKSIAQVDEDSANAFNLYLKIDTDRIVCLNEAVEDSGKHIFKPWSERLSKEKVFFFNSFNIFLLIFIININSRVLFHFCQTRYFL